MGWFFNRGNEEEEQESQPSAEVEQYAQSQSIKIQKKSKTEREQRYDKRKWSREGNENLEKWRSGKYYDEPEPEVKKIKVSKFEQEPVQSKSVKVPKKGMDESKTRFAQRKADRIMKEAKETGKTATKALANKLHGKHQEQVHDEETKERVDKALKSQKSHHPAVKTRSQELAEIKDKAYAKQQAAEYKKRIASENAKAERSGARSAMGVWDASVDRVAEVAETKRGIEAKIDEAREKISPGSTRVKPKAQQAKPQPRKISAAEKKRIAQAQAKQINKSFKALAPQKRTPFAVTRGAPFGVQKNTLTVQKTTGSLNHKNTSALTSLNKGNPFGSSHKGNPFGTSQGRAPFGISNNRGAPFATGRTSNPIGYSANKRIPRLI